MKAAVVGMTVAAMVTAGQAAVIFSDDMPGTAANLPQGSWRGVRHISNGNAAEINGSVSSDSNDPGANSRRLFVGQRSDVANGDLLLHTTDTGFAAAVTESQSIGDYLADSWSITYWIRNDVPSSPQTLVDRLALQVDGQWYVRNAASTSIDTFVSGGQTWTKFQVEDPFGTSGWTTLSFDETGSTSLTRISTAGSAPTGSATLPSSGTLEGIGLWASTSTNGGGTRLDLVQIEAVVPEPASLGLLMASAMLVGRRVRK